MFNVSKMLLTEEQFSRIVVTRARKGHPDLKARVMGKSILMVEPEPGQPRLVPLFDLYQTYCDCPTDRDDMIESFLKTLSGGEAPPRAFAEVEDRIMPQVVPPTLLEVCRRDGRGLASMECLGELAVAFVIDEPERYSYIQKSLLTEWGVDELTLLTTAMRNLQALVDDGPEFDRFGQGARLALVSETFDGYDASRVLLTRQLQQIAVHVAGTPVIAIPHRDYLVVFGDLDGEFVTEMSERVSSYFASHPYPVSSDLLTIVDGRLEPYGGARAAGRMIN